MTPDSLMPATPVPLADLPTGLPRGLTLDDALRVVAALDAAHAESTRIVYAHTWRVWERWCTSRGISSLPAEPAVLAAYLVERAATGTAVASLNMACTAIRHMHRQDGLANPAEDELVRQVRLGLRRTYGTAPRRQARPLTVPEIRQIIDAIDRTTPIGARDAAIILMGYASAMRGSELVALTLADIEAKPGGILVSIRHSKTDPEHRGQIVAVAHGSNADTDPVAALAAWLKIRGDHPGALITRIWGRRISDQPLGNHVVARMLRARAVAAGLDGSRITAHSLRAGHATTAALAGVPLPGSPRRPGTRTSTSWSTATSGPSKPSPPPPARTSASETRCRRAHQSRLRSPPERSLLRPRASASGSTRTCVGRSYGRTNVVGTVMGSPGRPKMLRISAGSVPVLPNQCGTVVSNAATSPGPSTRSWSPSMKRMWPDKT
jgi:integrase